MTTVIDCLPAAAKPAPDLKAVKTKQHAAWSSGDYALIGVTLQIVGEQMAEALDLRAGQKVLDIAAGNGNATLAAALVRRHLHRLCGIAARPRPQARRRGWA